MKKGASCDVRQIQKGSESRRVGKNLYPCFDSKNLRKSRGDENLFYSLIDQYVLVNLSNFKVCVQFVLINMALCVACRS